MLVDTRFLAPYNRLMRLGLLLREHRRRLGMTTTQVAELIGVKQSAVSKWENGTSQPDDDKLDAIAAFLGLARSEVVLLRDGVPDEVAPDRVTALEARLDRVELALREMVDLLRDLDRRIGRSGRGRRLRRSRWSRWSRRRRWPLIRLGIVDT